MRKGTKGNALAAVHDSGEGEFGDAGNLGFIEDFGYPGEFNPAYGALAAAALTEAGILTAKHMRPTHPGLAKWAGLVGLVAGGLPSTAALFFDRTRRAGWLGLAVTAVAAGAELLRSHFVEPQLGMYAPEMTDGVQILDADMAAEAAIQDALAEGLQIMGQSTPQQALGMYAPEMTGGLGYNPMEVSGYAGAPYSGSLSAY
jgi:hypothetical protein